MTAQDLARAEAIRRRIDLQADAVDRLVDGAQQASRAVVRVLDRLTAQEPRS